ncbi:MAG: hypothetical protein GX425_07745 [Peptococcaceae bacterium]|nr:hypothetical protein [Peptococcaceae bacterium]
MHWYVIGRLPGLIVDHIDGNGLNNQKYNLRHVTTRQNGQNLHIKKSSRFPGVYWHSTSKKWASMIKIGDTKKFLGNFDSELAAFNAYYLKLKEIGEIPHFFLKGEIKNAFI